MDTELLNFRDGEHFSTFDTHSFLDDCPDDSVSLDGTNNFSSDLYEWEYERELNGDVALIPMSGTYNTMNHLSDSPPSKEDFQKIMSDWQQFINIDTDSIEDYVVDDPIIDTEENNDEISEDENILPDSKCFDITSYMTENATRGIDIPERKIKAGVKKIDMRAQKYIVEEDESGTSDSESDNDDGEESNDGNNTEDDNIDVETISESGNSPVLEARDLNSLLEQFEATELPDLPCKFDVSQENAFNDYNLIDKRHLNILKLDQLEENLNSNDDMNLSSPLIDILEEPTTNETSGNVLSGNKSNMNSTSTTTSKDAEIPQTQKLLDTKDEIKKEPHSEEEEQQPLTSPGKQSPKTPSTTSPLAIETAKTKQILESLPQELIARIKESGKRKPISVIPPIPSKRRGGPRMQEAGAQLCRNKLLKLVSNESIQLDHDYCSSNSSPYPKHPKKDSGFESAEEEDRTVIRQQPTVKNADGKLMVSLLKVNTIVRNIESNQKKKLNLEEYKRRRDGVLIKSNENSQCNSPNNSTCNSPLPEDENLRMLKHQEKLMKMAKEILKAAPKSNIKPELQSPVKEVSVSILPDDMEMKTLVSIGVNTICEEGKDPIAPVEQLEEIKPLLKTVKIDGSSLITSLIENIPKVRNKNKVPPDSKDNKGNVKEHGEDKTIVYLPKNRTAIKTTSVGVQTNITLVKEDKESRYRRRRNSSSSSCSSSSNRSERYRRRHKRSSSRSSRRSRGSRSDSYSSSTSYRSSSSRSRSRSVTPRRTNKRTHSPDPQHLKEVEERRVIYVGRITSSTRKDDLRKRFTKFGPITNISLHFRDHGYNMDHYGFVTFANKLDAYEAIEHGNDDPYFPKYDLSFGGRRLFCKTSYSDLDDMRDEAGYYPSHQPEDSFDNLLREVQQKLRKRHA